jgi:hypothetical protein
MSLMMGTWFLATAFSETLAALFGKLAAIDVPEGTKLDFASAGTKYADLFWLMTGIGIGWAVLAFLAAGGQDKRAPIEHSKMMESALRKAGVPVETLYYDTEAHGFYTQEHRQEFYTRLLAFLSRSLGGAVAAVPASAGDAKAAK